MDLDVSIIVSNRNGSAMLRACLESLHGAGRPQCRHEILVADNGSIDGSVAMVRDDFPGVRVLAHERDLGFVASNNKAIAASHGLYVHLLNNDTIVLPGAIDQLVTFLDHEPTAGAIGNRLIFPDGREQFSGRRFPTPLNAIFGRRSVLSRWFPQNRWTRRYTVKEELAGDTPFEVDWVSAAGALYRRQALEDTGAMFEQYYYWHEAAYFLAMRRKGWRVFLHPNAWIVHYEGHGSGVRSPMVWARHHFDFARGSYQFYCDHRELGALDPRRALTRLMLFARASVLAAAGFVRPAEAPTSGGDDSTQATRIAYGRLVQQLLSVEGSGHLVLVTGVTTGEGVSTAATALALELSLRGHVATLLVDANGDQPVLHRLFWQENGRGFSDLSNGSAPEPATLVRRIAPLLAFLPHGHTRCDLASTATLDQLVSRLHELAAGYRFVIVDAAPLDRRIDALALAQRVDGVILVVRSETVDREHVYRATGELRDAGANLLGAIYNAEPHYIPDAIYRRV